MSLFPAVGRVLAVAALFRVSTSLIGISSYSENPCKESTPCHCILHNGSVIELATEGLSNGNARFSMEHWERDKKDVFFSYNPCFPFADNSKDYLILEPPCENVAACWYENISSIMLQRQIKTGFGNPNTATFFWETKDTELAIHYITETSKGKKVNDLYVILKCNPTQNDSWVKAKNAKKDSLTLNFYSKCACLDGCPLVTNGLSVGSIILIVLACSIVLYLSVGILVKVFVLHESGINILPHYSFWSSLPSLIKDGALFSVSCCCCVEQTPRYTDL